MVSVDCLEWLSFAHMDIAAAQSLYKTQENPRHRPIEIILFHCQQGAEKALKAFIIQHGVLTSGLQTHKLQLLRQACATKDIAFGRCRIIKHCALLDPFSVTTRYPKHYVPLDSALALRGLNSAKRVYNFVCRRLNLDESNMIDYEKSPDSSVEEAQPAYDTKFTYADYVQWDDDVRRELINGVPYLMAEPSLRHQEILGNLHMLFKAFLKGKTCKVFLPIDVRLNADTLDDTVVQPDLVIICDQSILDAVCCKGVPDMVVEILSPSTARYDKTLKYNTYLKTGIREYWIIDPKEKTIAVHILKDGNYITHAYSNDENVPVHVLEGCIVNLPEVFEE